jgi:hypothetical protein
MVLLIAGCTTTKVDQSQYIRDGIQYGQGGKTVEGKKQGSFRGRWWNYYVRGRSYSDGQFFAEAEADMRTALAQRTKDQRWARTYGLHFISEYFPNRELGIVLFNQEKYKEALPYLESSNEQAPSARAAYYLDQIRAVLYSDSDQTPPLVTFTTSNSSQTVYGSSIILSAQVTDDTYVKSIRIGNRPYPIQVSSQKPIYIETSIPLNPGKNTIPIHVTDISGKEATYTFEVTTDHEGPVISFDRPITLPGIITGVLDDPAEIESLQIGGIDVTLVAGDAGVTEFSFEVSREHLNTFLQATPSKPFIFNAKDKKGNSTNGLVPRDTLLVSDRHSEFVLAARTDSVPLHNGLMAIIHNGEIAALTLSSNEETLAKPRIDITNAIEGQRYRLEEIILGMVVAAPYPIEKMSINGVNVDTLVPGRKEQNVSRRISLPEEENTVTIKIEDSSGARETQKITIRRELTDIHRPENRLNLAILGNIWAGTAPDLTDEADYITRRLKVDLAEQKRFSLLEDTLMESVIEERELIAAFGDKKARQTLSSELLQAEVLVIGKIHRSFDSIEIILEAIDPVSSSVIGYADVAGPNNTRTELQELSTDLALRFQQLFPLAQGEVLPTQNKRKLQTTLNQSQGVSKNLRCIIYRRSPEQFHEITGESLGFNTRIIADGHLTDVKKDQSFMSVIDGDSQDGIFVQATDFVITK